MAMGWLFCGLPCAHDEIGSRFCFKSNISVVTYKLNFRPQIWPLRSFYSISIIIEHNPLAWKTTEVMLTNLKKAFYSLQNAFFLLPKTRHTAMWVPFQVWRQTYSKLRRLLYMMDIVVCANFFLCPSASTEDSL